MNDNVKIFRYVTEGTFDSYSWQLIENKQKFIGQIMTSKSPVRSSEDIDEAALSYAEVKALATGNSYIKEKMDLDIQVSKLKLLKANHTSQRYRLEDNIAKHYPMQVTALKERLEGYRTDIQTYAAHKPVDKDAFPMKIGNRTYTDKKEAGAALIDMCRSAKQPNKAVTIGEYQGFKLIVSFDSFLSKFTISLKGSLNHEVEIGADPLGNLQRLSNALEGMTGKMADTPDIETGTKPIAFGDFSYYWIVGRKPVTVRTLLEKFVLYDQIGYLAFEFLDGKLVRNEAIKVIQMADAGK